MWVTDRPTEGQEEYIKIKVAAARNFFAESSVRMQMRQISGSEFRTNKDQSTYIIIMILSRMNLKSQCIDFLFGILVEFELLAITKVGLKLNKVSWWGKNY